MPPRMNIVLRRTGWIIRTVRMKIQNIPLQTCKACLRCMKELWETAWNSTYVLVVSLVLLSCLVIGLVYFRDPCFQWEIKTRLCDDYSKGLIAGALCYDLCVEQAISLSSCVEQRGALSVFEWDDLYIKARLNKDKLENDVNEHIWEGMTVADFWTTLQQYLTTILGDTDHSNIIERAVQFVDFNGDSKLQYGEVRSFWQLLQIHEFQTLLIFHANSVFPTLNGTCGSLYAVEMVYQTYLYDKPDPSVLDKVFPHRYRWGMADFPRRAHISLGLLEYAYSTLEEENTRFYMCNLSPKTFGHSRYYEMKVSNLEGIVSENVLNRTLQGTHCDADADCVYGDMCHSTCNLDSHNCTGISLNYIPDIVKICRIIQEYLLHDVPPRLKQPITQYVSDCLRIEKKIQKQSNELFTVKENLAIERLGQVLWDELKYSDMKWNERPTKRPRT